jgi:ribosomal-protein-alanine N-acetyltransferase
VLSLETDRLTIRCFRPDDWNELQELSIRYQATEAAKHEDPWPTTAEAVKGMAAWFATGEDYLAVCLKSTGKLIGLVAINRTPEQEGRVHNLGYVFHPDYHGQGYATESCRAAMARVFGELAADAILTRTREANVASVRLLTRLGLRSTGTGAGEYKISKDDWLQLQRQEPGVGSTDLLPGSPSVDRTSMTPPHG